MCVSVSVTDRIFWDKTETAVRAASFPISNVSIAIVQEAVFYDLRSETIFNVITAAIENYSGRPIYALFSHKEAVTQIDLRQTLINPVIDPHTEALVELLNAVTGPSNLFLTHLPEYSILDYASESSRFSLPNEVDEQEFKDSRPFTCSGFGPLATQPRGTFHIVRFAITITSKVFSRLVRKINGTKQYFYEIIGPATILDDIRYSHLTHLSDSARHLYVPIFDSIICRNHIPIQLYEILTFDIYPGSGEQVRYNRGLAEARQLLEDYKFDAKSLGALNVNAWDSRSERFVILRGSTDEG